MIPYKVFPMFELGPLHFNMYGIMFALGAFAAIMIAAKEAKKRNIDEDIIHDLAMYMLIGGIIGARLFYVLFYWPKGVDLSFLDIFKVWEGGLAFFGGFLGGVITAYIYTRRHKLDFWNYADIFTIPLIAGHILGRIGDYLTGGHPGKITNLPWAIFMENAPRHPVVLYEIIGLLIILLIIFNLNKFFNKKKIESRGSVFLVYVMLYSLQRMFLDLFRLDSTDPRFMGLTPSQFVVIILFITAVCVISSKYRTHIKNRLLALFNIYF